MGKSRSMRSDCQLPPNRWDEFVLTSCYLTNRVPTSALNHNSTPYKAYYNRKPSLHHLREIGCRAFVLIQNKNNPKIYERSYECVLIGYSPNSKAYRLYHRPTHKVVVSYHVHFIESKDSSPRTFQPGRVLPSVLNMLDNDHDITQDSGFESILPAQQSPNSSSTSTSPPPSPPSPKRASVSPELKLPQPAKPPSPLFPTPEPRRSTRE